MVIFHRFEQICLAMADPAFYPHPVSHLERRETHISTVFLTGTWAYKLKKPVYFGFLDFRNLDARRYYCEQEVRLNQRLSKGIYEGVVEIRQDGKGRFSLGGTGEVVEYAVKMRQLPEDTSLRTLLKRSKISGSDMENLGQHLAAFYRSSISNSEIDHFGDPETIAFNMEENFRQIEPFVGDLVAQEQWEFIREVSRTFFHHWHSLFENRVRKGRICDGHGDLRTEHVYFTDRIQIIDCIEFNDRFRYGDIIVDLAFLHMDMERLGHADLSRSFLSSYVKWADDPELYALLDFYAGYRAIVKVKVACLRSTETENQEERIVLKQEAKSYLEHAYRYALQFSRPTLWIFFGLPATGKSTLAERVSQALSLPLFQSDRIRKEGIAYPPFHRHVVLHDQGIYRLEMRQRVYARMLELAQGELKKGHSVILDATFSRRQWQEEARRLATDLDTNLIFVECGCKEETIRRRLQERERMGNLSDARVKHLPDMIREFEPFTGASPETYLKVNTDQPLHKTILEVLSEAHARKCAQIRQIIQEDG